MAWHYALLVTIFSALSQEFFSGVMACLERKIYSGSILFRIVVQTMCACTYVTLVPQAFSIQALFKKADTSLFELGEGAMSAIAKSSNAMLATALAVAQEMVTINGFVVSVDDALKQPGHVLGGNIVNVAPDGRCAASTIVAAFNVMLYMTTPRTEAGYALILEDVKREESQAREWLEGVGTVAKRHGKLQYFERLMALAGGACAEADDFQIYAKAIHHCIVVEPAEQGAPVHIFGKPKWPTGLWVKQVYLKGKGHYQLVQSWLQQNPTMSPPSPLSRPGSSKDMLPSQFTESQESVPAAPKRRPKRKASPKDAQTQKRQKSGVTATKSAATEAIEKLKGVIEEARVAIAEEERAVKTLSKRTK